MTVPDRIQEITLDQALGGRLRPELERDRAEAGHELVEALLP